MSHFLLLALIVGFAALLRFFSLSSLGYWTDELCTLSAADGWGLQLDKVPTDRIAPPLPNCTRLKDARPFAHIPVAMAHDDAHPPLYFMILRAWEEVFGDSESSVRSVNVVFSLLAIVMLYVTATRSVGSATALVACLLMAVATPQIQLAQEARNYMPVLVFSLLAVFAIQRLRHQPDRLSAFLLTVSLLAMMLTHYFAAGAAAGIVLDAVIVLRSRARQLMLFATLAAGILFVLLWGPALMQQRAVFHNGLGWLSDSSPGHLHRRVIDLLRLPVRFFAEITTAGAQNIVAAVGFVMLLGLPILFFRRRELRLWIAWFVSAVALIAILDFSRSTAQLNWVRYSFFAAPPAYVLVAAAIQGRRWKWLLPALAVVLSLLNLRNAYVPAWKIDFRTPVQFVGRQLGPRDGLLIVGRDTIADGILYSACQQYLPTLPPVSAVLTKDPDEQTLVELKRCRRICVMTLWPNQTLQLPGFLIQDQQTIPYFANVQFGRFER